MSGGIFLFHADHPDWLRCILAHDPGPLGEAAKTSAGWRIVFFQDGDVLMKSHPGEDDSGRFVEVLGQVRTRAMLGHFLWQPREDHASGWEGPTTLRSNGWAYSQDRETAGFGAVRDKFRGALPPFLARGVRGKGEAEHLFLLSLAFLYDAGKLSDPDLPPAEIVTGVRSALRMAGEIYPQAGLPPPSISLIISNGYGAAGWAGSCDLPVRVHHRPEDADDVLDRGVGDRRASGEIPSYPRTGERAVLVGQFVWGEQPGTITTTIAHGSFFGVGRRGDISIYEE